MILPDRMEEIVRKTVRGIVLMLFIISMINCSYAYSDINNEHWAYEAINELTNKNILSGYPDGTFRPNSNITRAEFCSIIIRSTGSGVFEMLSASLGSSTPGFWMFFMILALVSFSSQVLGIIFHFLTLGVEKKTH